ncbi:MAG: endonuclease/exonuclease/phosphatase family protein [Bacteroidales bacterium]|nr:endonuclease/exonuclease/phosphatase family protein [Bacteroidales bacterium]
MKRLSIIVFFTFLIAITQGVTAQETKIISFNIRYNSWNNIDGENGWPNRRSAVVKMINEERPVAIGLQEALIDQLRYLDSCLPSYRRIGVGRDNGKEEGEFMAIYYDTSRLELLSGETHWLSTTPLEPSLGWDAACRRTVTTAHFHDRLTKKDFCYFNTHLDHVGKTARAEGANLIAALVNDRKLPEGTPIIVGGDMNSTIDDSIFQVFYNVGLKVARDMTKTTSYKETYTGFGKDKPSLIDHFFVRDTKVKKFRTLDGDYGVPYISDHYPIEIFIKF